MVHINITRIIILMNWFFTGYYVQKRTSSKFSADKV